MGRTLAVTCVYNILLLIGRAWRYTYESVDCLSFFHASIHCTMRATFDSRSSVDSLWSSTTISLAYDDRASSRTTSIISASLFSCIFLRGYPLSTCAASQRSRGRRSEIANTPLLQAIPEFCMVATEDDNEIRPSLGEDFTCVPV